MTRAGASGDAPNRRPAGTPLDQVFFHIARRRPERRRRRAPRASPASMRPEVARRSPSASRARARGAVEQRRGRDLRREARASPPARRTGSASARDARLSVPIATGTPRRVEVRQARHAGARPTRLLRGQVTSTAPRAAQPLEAVVGQVHAVHDEHARRAGSPRSARYWTGSQPGAGHASRPHAQLLEQRRANRPAARCAGTRSLRPTRPGGRDSGAVAARARDLREQRRRHGVRRVRDDGA